MKCLVTGGAGFIGAHLAERLVALGHRVRVLDNFSTGRRENLAAVLEKIELINGDMVDPATCRRACDSMEYVFHQAAVPSVPKSIEDPVTSHRANADGTFNLLLAARDVGVKRFIYAASSSAYGESEVLPKVETLPSRPLSPYAVQKLMGENYCTAFCTCFGLQTISLRYFNVFGPRQNPKSQYAAAIPSFITSILKNEPPIVYGDGEQTRDFTYIENVVEANILAANAPTTRGEAINIACGEHVTVNSIIQRINAQLGKNIRPKYLPKRAGDIQHSWAGIDLASRVIGYKPVVQFQEGLSRVIRWYSEHYSK